MRKIIPVSFIYQPYISAMKKVLKTKPPEVFTDSETRLCLELACRFLEIF